VQRERGRLLAFIRRRIADAAEAEDVLQDALYELVLAYRMMQPVEQARAWLTRVARNRIIDRFRSRAGSRARFRRRRRARSSTTARSRICCPRRTADRRRPSCASCCSRRSRPALEELPREQREVFVAHEIDGVSFKELSARSGVSVNTLLSRKRYALLHLQQRLRAAWDHWFTDMRRTM